MLFILSLMDGVQTINEQQPNKQGAVKPQLMEE